MQRLLAQVVHTLGIRTSLETFLVGVVVQRRTRITSVGIPGEESVLVQPLCSLNQFLRHRSLLTHILQQTGQGMPPGCAAKAQEDALQGFVGGLLRRKTRPVVVSSLSGMSRVSQVMLCLLQPVERTIRHRDTLVTAP